MDIITPYDYTKTAAMMMVMLRMMTGMAKTGCLLGNVSSNIMLFLMQRKLIFSIYSSLFKTLRYATRKERGKRKKQKDEEAFSLLNAGDRLPSVMLRDAFIFVCYIY